MGALEFRGPEFGILRDVVVVRAFRGLKASWDDQERHVRCLRNVDGSAYALLSNSSDYRIICRAQVIRAPSVSQNIHISQSK